MLDINFLIGVNKAITGHGDILSKDLLESAFSSYHYYEKLEEQIASIYRGISKNHAFRDGNKRTAATAFLVLLDECNLETPLSDDEFAKVSVKVASSQLDIPEIARLLFGEY